LHPLESAAFARRTPDADIPLFAVACYTQWMRQCPTLLILIWLGAPAFADEVEAAKPREPVVCEVVQTAVSICTKPCTWAKSQPDFQYSFNACVADCQKQNPCVGVELQVR
jgi:hypothetical protein